MKYFYIIVNIDSYRSPSSWAEWVEITFSDANRFKDWSPSSWAEWVEIFYVVKKVRICLSPSSWAEWVEMFCSLCCASSCWVSVLVGGVG